MSKPRYNWWGHAKNLIRDYPELKQQYDDLHRQKVTPNYSGMPSGSGSGRVLEEVVLRELPACKQREYDAVAMAIDSVRRLSYGNECMKMIDLVYWKRTHTLEGAALMLNIHPQTGKNWNGDFIRRIGRNMGWMDGL